MRRVCGSVLVLAIVVFAASAAPAPEARPLGGLESGVLAILSNSHVRDELKITEDQLKKIGELKAQRRQSLDGLRGLNKEDRAKKSQERAKAAETALAKILTRKQLRRAEQIYLQLRGPMVWTLPQVAAALKLTDEQKEKMALIKREWLDELRDRRSKGKVTIEQDKEMSKKRDEKLLNVLTPAQKTKWKELLGEPFTWKSDAKEPKQPAQASDRPPSSK